MPWSIAIRPQTDECITLRSVMKGVLSAPAVLEQKVPALHRHSCGACRPHSPSGGECGRHAAQAQIKDPGTFCRPTCGDSVDHRKYTFCNGFNPDRAVQQACYIKGVGTVVTAVLPPASSQLKFINLVGGGRMRASGLILCCVGTPHVWVTSPYRWFSWKPSS